MIREINNFLNRIEFETEEQMRQPVDLQFLNWLEGFLFEVYNAGKNNSSEFQNQYDKGYHDGYKDGKEEYQQ